MFIFLIIYFFLFYLFFRRICFFSLIETYANFLHLHFILSFIFRSSKIERNTSKISILIFALYNTNNPYIF